MKLESTSHFNRSLNKLTKKNRKLPTLLDKTVEKFISNPNHPGIKLHKLSGGKSNYWSLTVSKNIRLIFKRTKNHILFTDIGSHDEVY